MTLADADPAAALQEELDEIDHVLETFGFDSTRAAQELQGALERLRKLELERGTLSTEAARVPELVDKIARLRAEVRRLSQADRYRAQGADAMKLHLLATERVSTLQRALLSIRANPPQGFTERALDELTRLLKAAAEEP